MSVWQAVGVGSSFFASGEFLKGISGELANDPQVARIAEKMRAVVTPAIERASETPVGNKFFRKALSGVVDKMILDEEEKLLVYVTGFLVFSGIYSGYTWYMTQGKDDL